jgi:hypothetical protein
MSVALAFGATVLLAGPAAPPVIPVAPIMVDTTVAEYFAVARMQLRAGQSREGLATYLRGAVRANTVADRELYAADLGWIATRTELAVWRNSASAPRTEFLRAFWTSRGAASGVAAGERLAEHVRRLEVAAQRYPISPKRGRPPMMRVSTDPSVSEWPTTRQLRDFVPSQGELDDRAVIFIRHGEPAERTVSARAGIESWTYERDGESVTVHFAETLFDGTSGNGTLIAVPPVSAFAALCQADDAYCRLAARQGPTPPEQLERIRQHALAAIRTLTTTDG